MQFCKCGSIMLPSGGRLKCRSCGAEASVEESDKIKSTTKKEEVIVIEKNETALPETTKECPKCGNKRACWWLIQTRSSDEPPTQFFRCTKCKNVWREYK